jgi:threonine dehydratase
MAQAGIENNSSIQVLAVQAEMAPAVYLSWKSGEPVTGRMETFAEGLATRGTFELTQSIMRRHLDDFVLVSEQEIKRAVILMLQHTHNLAEGAGAAPLAAALKLKDQLAGKRVVLVLSGGNLSLANLKDILD